jgi:hypothetical protein
MEGLVSCESPVRAEISGEKPLQPLMSKIRARLASWLIQFEDDSVPIRSPANHI